MQNPSFDKNLVNVKQQVHRRQDRLKSSVSLLGHKLPIYEGSYKPPDFKSVKENDGNFYNFAVNTTGLKDWILILYKEN